MRRRAVGSRPCPPGHEEVGSVHVVVVGCGRVGSGLAASRRGERPHRRGHRPPGQGVRPPRPTDFSGTHRRRRRLRPRPPQRGRHRGGRGARRRDQRRQLEHPRRPRRPRDLRHRAGRRPHLRPAPGRDLPAPRHPHRRHRAVDDRAGAAPASCPTAPAVEWIDPSAKVCLVERRVPGRVGRARRSPTSRSPAGARVVGAHPARRGARSRPPDLVAQEGDVVYVAVAGDAIDAFDAAPRPDRTTGGALMRVVIAGGGNVGTFIAERPASRPATTSSILESTPTGSPRRERTASRRACRGSRPTRCEVSELGRADVEQGRRRRRRHRRRRGQPRHLAARQAGVRACPASSPA